MTGYVDEGSSLSPTYVRVVTSDADGEPSVYFRRRVGDLDFLRLPYLVVAARLAREQAALEDVRPLGRC